jgi:hypothetical protein
MSKQTDNAEYIRLLTPAEVSIIDGFKLSLHQLEDKIKYLNKEIKVVKHVIDINYIGEVESIASTYAGECGCDFMLMYADGNPNLYRQVQKMYNLLKLRTEYEYMMRNFVVFDEVEC